MLGLYEAVRRRVLDSKNPDFSEKPEF